MDSKQSKEAQNNQSAESTKSDDELDVTSDKFNPLKALYSDKFKVPCKNVRPVDNLSMFMSKLEQAGNSNDADLESSIKKRQQKERKPTEEVDTEKYHVTAHGRVFLKEQAPVHRSRKAKFTRNVLTRMENCKGPISLLSKFRTNNIRVKIYIRRQHGIRGYMTGFIEAFDKHFNIALTDCIEVWKRRKFDYSDNNVPLLGEPSNCSKRLAELGIKIPEITAKSLNRKNVQCTRRIPKLMIRGEDVVLVCKDTEMVTDLMTMLKV